MSRLFIYLDALYIILFLGTGCLLKEKNNLWYLLKMVRKTLLKVGLLQFFKEFIYFI